MPNLSIKDVPESVIATLRERATRNHRSLQGELMAIICQVAATSNAEIRPVPARADDTKTIEQLATELAALWKEAPPVDAPLAVDIVRASRDAR